MNAGRVRSAFFVKKILLSGRWPEREGLRRLMIVREYERKDFMIDFKVVRKEMEWGGRKLVLETGKLARQAQGAVVVTYGETEVIATVCAAKEAKADQDFFPLTVNYQEKYYATGKVPGGFMKREGKPSEREVLLSRLIDRPIRPLFPDAFKNEVQVICTVLSHDQNTDSDIPAMIAASAALSISGIPFLGPIEALPWVAQRICPIPKWVFFSLEEFSASTVDRLFSFPLALKTSIALLSFRAIPAES